MSLSQSFYSQLPETSETQFAKSVAELQSEVRQCFIDNTISAQRNLVCIVFFFSVHTFKSYRMLKCIFILRCGTRRRVRRA